ncbi:MAG: hypothetical protein F9K32_01610 [Desulfobulbaceae bacterium]|nr:MAG: hypothetical protein F9K32_01610 [Desulfobulbaceae bacterium]
MIVTLCQDFSFALELLKNLKTLKKISTPWKDCKPNRHAEAVVAGALEVGIANAENMMRNCWRVYSEQYALPMAMVLGEKKSGYHRSV